MQTPKLVKENYYGRATEIRVGEMNCTIGMIKMLILKLEQFLGYEEEAGGCDIKSGTANTALTNHANHTYALMEQNLPWEIQFDKTSGKFTLESIDFDDFLGSLLDPVGAHPKVDRDNEHLLNLAYDVNKGTCIYYRYDVNRQLMNKVEIHTATPRMIHDLQITKDYIIVADLPLEFDP